MLSSLSLLCEILSIVTITRSWQPTSGKHYPHSISLSARWEAPSALQSCHQPWGMGIAHSYLCPPLPIAFRSKYHLQTWVCFPMSILNNGHSGEKDDQAVASIKVHACPIYFSPDIPRNSPRRFLWRVSGKKKNTKTMAKVFNDTIPVQTCQSTHNASGPLGPHFFYKRCRAKLVTITDVNGLW